MNVYIFFRKIGWKWYKVSGLIICTKVNKWISDSSAVTHSQKVLVPHSVTCKFYTLLSPTEWAWTWSSILSARYSTGFTKRVKDDFIWSLLPVVGNHYVWVATVPRFIHICIYIYIYTYTYIYICVCVCVSVCAYQATFRKYDWVNILNGLFHRRFRETRSNRPRQNSRNSYLFGNYEPNLVSLDFVVFL
jgi:hypothetical protein